MKKNIKLGSLIQRSKEIVELDDQQEYKQVKIRLHYKGVELRHRKFGSEIGTKRQYLVRPGQFILSRIDARNGAFGIVPDDLDGAIITGDFLSFEINNDQVDPVFFEYMIQSPVFLDACKRSSKGTTNRKRIKEEFLLDYEVEIPSLPEQRVVAKQLQDIDNLLGDIRSLSASLKTYKKDFITKNI